MKFNYHDARYILERASARETAARVAAGAFAKLLLKEFGTEIASHTIQVGHIRLERPATWKKIRAVSSDLDSPLRCIDPAIQEEMNRKSTRFSKPGTPSAAFSKSSLTTFPWGSARTRSGTKDSMAAWRRRS
jgi:chorismate synthase